MVKSRYLNVSVAAFLLTLYAAAVVLSHRVSVNCQLTPSGPNRYENPSCGCYSDTKAGRTSEEEYKMEDRVLERPGNPWSLGSSPWRPKNN